MNILGMHSKWHSWRGPRNICKTITWKTKKRPDDSGNILFERIEKHLDTFTKYIGVIVDMVVEINAHIGNITIQGEEKMF